MLPWLTNAPTYTFWLTCGHLDVTNILANGWGAGLPQLDGDKKLQNIRATFSSEVRISKGVQGFFLCSYFFDNHFFESKCWEESDDVHWTQAWNMPAGCACGRLGMEVRLSYFYDYTQYRSWIISHPVCHARHSSNRLLFFFFARCTVLSKNANQGLQITINEKMEKLLKVRKRMAKRQNSVKNKRYAFRQHNTAKSYFLLKHILKKYVGRKD